MMRSWTVPLSSWRWASAACCMGMDVRADDPARSAAAEQQKRLTAPDVQLPEDPDGRLGRAGQRGGIDPRDGVWLAGPDRRQHVLGVPAQAEQQGSDAVADGRADDTG